MNSLADSTPSPSVTAAAALAARRGRDLDRLTRAVQIVSILLVVAALWWAQALLIPLVLSVLISYGLEPVIVRFASWHVPRSVAVPVLLTLLVAACGVSAYVLRGEATSFVERLAGAARTIARNIQGGQAGTPETVAKVQEAARELEAAVNKATTKNAPEGVTPVRIEEPTFKWSDWVWQGSHSTAEFGGQMFVVLVLVYYLSVSGDLYKRKLVQIMPTLSDKKITVEILGEIDRQIERFLLARAVISLLVGVAVWATFRLLGLEEAGVWGMLSAVLFVVPFAGPILVIAGAAVIAFVQFGSIGTAAAAGGICAGIGAIEGYVLTPWLMSRVGEMNAVAVFVSLLFWGWIWGAWGLLLAVPITAAVKAVCDRIPEWASIGALLSE